MVNNGQEIVDKNFCPLSFIQLSILFLSYILLNSAFLEIPSNLRPVRPTENSPISVAYL